jgi:hypothetical protein
MGLAAAIAAALRASGAIGGSPGYADSVARRADPDFASLHRGYTTLILRCSPQPRASKTVACPALALRGGLRAPQATDRRAAESKNALPNCAAMILYEPHSTLRLPGHGLTITT